MPAWAFFTAKSPSFSPHTFDDDDDNHDDKESDDDDHDDDDDDDDNEHSSQPSFSDHTWFFWNTYLHLC